MTLTESSIYISLKRLRRLLFSAQFNMTKANRIVYGTPVMENMIQSDKEDIVKAQSEME